MEALLYTIVLWVALLASAQMVVQRWKISRGVMWLAAAVAVVIVERVFKDSHAELRMAVLCSSMLAMMKVIVYAEWYRQTGKRLTWLRWMMFAVLWFGMDPGAWRGRRRSLAWLGDVMTGLACFLLGWIACVMLVRYEVSWRLAVFISLSLAFHFGVLRLLTAGWRACGIPVRPLFRNPLRSQGVGDFWSGRWNLSFSQMMARTVQRPLLNVLGQKGAVFCVFLVSGLLHELAITLPVKSGYGMPTLYFILHGILTVTENEQWPTWVKKLTLSLGIVLPLPWLFPASFTEQVILPCLRWFTLGIV